MTALLNVPGRLWWLAAAGIIILAFVAAATTRHYYHCRCGETFDNPDDFDRHLQKAHRFE